MRQLLETVCIIRGRPRNLRYHTDRMIRSSLIEFNAKINCNLEETINIPLELRSSEIVKCKIIYTQKILSVDYSAYTPRQIDSLKIVGCPKIDYSLKYADRSAIDSFFRLRGNCSDIIISQNGLIMDTSIHNIAFYDGFVWLTPVRPLLNGTMRAFLLDLGLIRPAEIKIADLHLFKKARLFNAMLDWESKTDVPIDMFSE